MARKHSDRTTDGDMHWIDGLLQSARDALAEPFQPCFVMYDYKEQNATFERTRAGWRVSGIFDPMEAFFGHGEVDSRPISTVQYTQADPALAAAFVRRYREMMPVLTRIRGASARVSALGSAGRVGIRPAAGAGGRLVGGRTLRAWLEPILEACMAAIDAAGRA